MSFGASFIAVMAELTRNGMPTTQEEIVRLGARSAIAALGAPATDNEFIDAGYGLAHGLFGATFHIVAEAQRLDWIDMCERALRDAAEELILETSHPP